MLEADKLESDMGEGQLQSTGGDCGSGDEVDSV